MKCEHCGEEHPDISGDDWEHVPLDIEFRSPSSRVVSIRLNREEQRALTNAARFHEMKLSTWIKQQALEAAHKPLMRLEILEASR